MSFRLPLRCRPDVWFVTTTQALTWITDPKPLKVINSKYEPWDCTKSRTAVQKPCNLSNKCALPFKTQTSNITDTRYMETCHDCPIQYPWLGDAEGTGIVGRDNYIYSTAGGTGGADGDAEAGDAGKEAQR